MPVSFEERVDLAEEHLLGVFMDHRAAATVLGAPRAEMEALAGPASAGTLTLDDLGLDRELLASVLRTQTTSHDPEVEAVRAAYTTLAVNREMVLEAIREAAPAPSMRT